MKPETLEALRGSIRKWEGIVAGVESDLGTRNCPLCQRFGNGCDRNGEERCPVFCETDAPCCNDSPYEDWKEAQWDRWEKGLTHFVAPVTDDETVMCAVLELEFLKSLLPTDKT